MSVSKPATGPRRRLFFLAAGLAILVLALVASALAARSAGAAAPNAPAAQALPGYSSDIIQVKFVDGTQAGPNELLPAVLLAMLSSSSPLFTVPVQIINNNNNNEEHLPDPVLPDLSRWWQLNLAAGTDGETLLGRLLAVGTVEIAEFAPLPQPEPAVTPDFTGNQGYLGPATNGIDAQYAWTIPGGNGAGVTIYDVEYEWNQNHEDLSAAAAVILLLNPGDTAVGPFNDNNHGTAVLGELIADNDAKGVTGISWGAGVGMAPSNTANLGYNPANAILLALMASAPGDVILLEMQTTVCGLPDGTYGPSEWISSVFTIVKTATDNGRVVVAAAGNGGVDLDQAGCLGKFDRSVQDSGAIIVGAGGPPAFMDRQRLGFSSYGSRVDLQGWGDNVMTTGYGTFYVNGDDTTNPNFWYIRDFSGTSSASPIVAGAVADLQGIAINKLGGPLSPAQMATLLVQTGSPQQGNLAENIGPRPNLLQAIAQLVPGTIIIKKVTVPSGGAGLNFTDDIPSSSGSFTLNDGQTKIFSGVLADISIDYGVIESDPSPAFDLTAIDCDDDNSANPSFVDLGSGKATIKLDPGETVTCTFTNTQRGTIIIEKVEMPDRNTTFTYADNIAAPNIFSLQNGQLKTFPNVLPGNFMVTENPIFSHKLTDLVCIDDDIAGTPSAGDKDARKATINVDPGETVHCTFTNHLSVGGTTQFLTHQDSGTPVVFIAALAGGVAAALALTVASSWYVRRRWLGSRS